MAVFRIEKTNNYTVMSNYHLREKEMTLKAKGLLSLMLSLPNNWDYTIEGLVTICKENETAIKSTLKELKDFGYLEILKVQNQKGQFEYQYNIYEKPQSKKPEVENPLVENQGQLNTNKQNTKKINTNNIKEKKEKKETEYDILINNNFKDEELKETIYEFIKMRKSIKKPLTTRGLELIIKNLYKLSTDVHEQIEILNNSIMNNWLGIFPLKKDNVYINKNEKKQETFEEQVERYKREWGIEDED